METPTELREAAKRILWHAKLLIVCTGLGFLAPFFLLNSGEPTYFASTRFLVSPTTDGTTSIEDTVAAIATSPSQLGWALLVLGVDESPEAFVDDVTIRALGDSGTIELSVTDEDPVLAASLANALRARVSQVMRDSQQVIDSFPRILDAASPSAVEAIPPLRKQDLALGALFGLILGIAAAALIEALNPTLVGKEAIATELGAPILGALPLAPKGDSEDLHWVRWRLGAQAARAGVATVELTAAGPSVDLHPISAALVTNGSTPPPRPTEGNGGERASSLKVGVLDSSSVFPDGSAGLVVVTPRTIKRTAMGSATDVLRVTGWPAVGAIVYPRRGVVTRMVGTLAGGVATVGRTVLTSIKAIAVGLSGFARSARAQGARGERSRKG